MDVSPYWKPIVDTLKAGRVKSKNCPVANRAARIPGVGPVTVWKRMATHRIDLVRDVNG